MKKTLALFVSTLTVIGMANVASAQADGTYTFDSTVGDSAGYDGSTVIITGGIVTSYDLLETGYAPTTPANGDMVLDSPSFFQVVNFGTLQGFDGDVASEADGGYLYEVFGPNGSENGNWTTASASAPDAASTMELLGAAVVGLGACRRFLRR
jgi:hypothetical protein